MREQPLYTEDWIGLRKLDKSGRVVLVSCDSEHMVLSPEFWGTPCEALPRRALVKALCPRPASSCPVGGKFFRLSGRVAVPPLWREQSTSN